MPFRDRIDLSIVLARDKAVLLDEVKRLDLSLVKTQVREELALID